MAEAAMWLQLSVQAGGDTIMPLRGIGPEQRNKSPDRVQATGHRFREMGRVVRDDLTKTRAWPIRKAWGSRKRPLRIL